MKAILHQDLGWHDKAEEGSLTTRLAVDTQLIQDGMGEAMGTALSSFATFITGFVIAFVKGWKLALVMYVEWGSTRESSNKVQVCMLANFAYSRNLYYG